MSEELLKFQDVAAAIRKHALLVSGIVAVCLLASYTAAHTLPKKFKSITVLNIKNSYFQSPLGDGSGRDASEAYAEKQALIRQSLDDAFLDKLGETFGTFSTDRNAPKRAKEREILKKRVEWMSINPTNFQFGFVAREAEVSRKMNQFVLDHVMDSLIEERLRNLRVARDGLKRQIDSLGLASGGAANPIATTQPELLRAELATLEAKMRALESQYTPSHPSVVALRRKADAIRAMLKSAQGGAPETPEVRNKVLLTPGQKGAKSEFFEELSKKMGYIDIVMELEQSKKDVPYLEVIEKPTLPLAHIFPKTKNFLIGGFLCGILLSGVAVGFLQLKRASVLTPQFASRFLGAPLLGVLPSLKTAEGGDFIETQVGGMKNAPAPYQRK